MESIERGMVFLIETGGRKREAAFLAFSLAALALAFFSVPLPISII